MACFEEDPPIASFDVSTLFSAFAFYHSFSLFMPMIRRKEGNCATGQQQQQQSESPSEISIETPSNFNPLSSTIDDCPSLSSPNLQREPLSEQSPTWRSQVSELTTRTRKRDLILCQSIFLITSLVTAIMNCAITIFGMGIGVGLILGDTLRTPSRFPTNLSGSGDVDTTSSTTAHGNGNGNTEESTVVIVRPATSDCRAVIRRVPRSRPLSSDTSGFAMHSNPTLPAQ